MVKTLDCLNLFQLQPSCDLFKNLTVLSENEHFSSKQRL